MKKINKQNILLPNNHGLKYIFCLIFIFSAYPVFMRCLHSALIFWMHYQMMAFHSVNNGCKQRACPSKGVRFATFLAQASKSYATEPTLRLCRGRYPLKMGRTRKQRGLKFNTVFAYANVRKLSVVQWNK